MEQAKLPLLWSLMVYVTNSYSATDFIGSDFVVWTDVLFTHLVATLQNYQVYNDLSANNRAVFIVWVVITL